METLLIKVAATPVPLRGLARIVTTTHTGGTTTAYTTL
jgi:hypothetical protein